MFFGLSTLRANFFDRINKINKIFFCFYDEHNENSRLQPTIKYDPVIDKFQREFVTLNGRADFYASNIKDLHQEGKISLKVFLEMCREEGIDPHRAFH